MLALKKKREAEAKAKLAAAAEQQAAGTDAPTDSPGVKKVSISLLGVGGKKNKDNGGSKSNGKRRTPGEIRIQTDLDGGNVAEIDFPDPNDLTTFYVSVTPDSGYWKGATYQFLLDIPAQYDMR
eukprot:scaffold162_cov267-Chaetoceros_neogracile.AAC.30